MIKNERQYRVTKAQIGRFQTALKALGSSPGKNVHPLLVRAQREALAAQLQDLRAEAGEYESLQTGKKRVLKLDSFDALPRALVQARIARGLTQKALARKLGVKEQQIQRYEASDYATASFERLKQVVRALEVRIKEEALLGRTGKGTN